MSDSNAFSNSPYFDPATIGPISAAGLRVRKAMEGSISGLHRSPLHGVSPEFADYRSYTPGDDLRNLDWRVYGRTDRFYIKRYEEESNLRAYIVLDASASMNYERKCGTKFLTAARIAVAFAASLLRQRDSVGLHTFNTSGTNHLRMSSSESQLSKILDVLGRVSPAGETDLATVVSRLTDQIPRRGLVILISDMLTDLEALYDAMGKVLYGGHEMIVIHVLDRDELELPFKGSVLFRDMEGTEELFAEPPAFRNAYKKAMETFIAEVSQRCRVAGIDYLSLFTDEDAGHHVSHFLRERHRR
ncbi:MAG: DUF58 domain-containing protein [Planctomycetales bacterium]|nr:DUF58 domain-containing protein [Planctomycetales bacterium]